MNKWLINVASIIVLSVVAGILLPEGKTNKMIKSIFSIVCLFVLIMPLQYIVKSDYSISEIISSENEYQIDDSFLYFTNSKRTQNYENLCEVSLESEGFENIEVQIITNDSDIEYNIEKVYVNIENLVILENNQHININVEIKNLLADILNIKTEQIILND